jgi:hypothetical protein
VSTPIKFHTRNITRYFRSIDPAVIAEGREWYPRALAYAIELAEYAWGRKPMSVDENDDWDAEINKAAAVIAVLSPQVNWERNKMMAKLAYTAYRENRVDAAIAAWPGLKTNAHKAFAILGGIDPNEVVGGPKVRQFWFTIMNPSDPRAVVVDRHAFSVAAGKALTDRELGQKTGALGTYDAVSEMYRRAARILSLEIEATITPAEVQAITWTAWRREHAVTRKANRRTELQEV